MFRAQWPMTSAVKVSRRDVDAIVRATFPDYRGRKLRVAAAETVTLHDLNWSGGTRAQYRSCTLAGRFLGGADKFNAQAPWANDGEGVALPVPAGSCLVEHSIFCGHDCGLTIFVNPADMPKYLPAPLQVAA